MATVKKATRNLIVQLDVPQAAKDLASAVYSNLALNRNSVTKDVYEKLYISVYKLILHIIQGKPVSGEVPLPIFMLLASLRSRLLDLKQQISVSLQVSKSSQVDPVSLPVVSDELGDLSYFIQHASSLGGVLVDLREIAACRLGPFKQLGYQNEISIGRSLGPLNVKYAAGGMFGINNIRQEYPPTENWMRFFTWAYTWDHNTPQESNLLTFPNTNPRYQLTPGSIVLSHALRTAEVIGMKSFDFIPLDLACFKAFLNANAQARADSAITAAGFPFDLRAPLAVVSGVGLKAGQIAFGEPFFQTSNFQLPQDICESGLAVATYRDGNGRLPYVLTYLDDSVVMEYSDGTANGTVLRAKGVLPTDDVTAVIGLSDAEMSLDSAAFNNNTFLVQEAGALLTWDPAADRPTWASDDSTVTAANPVAINWNDLFKNTIGRGPLSRPCGDRIAGSLNMCDFTADRRVFADPVSGQDVYGFSSINCYKAGVHSPSLNVLASLPLPREAAVSDRESNGDFNFVQTSLERLPISIANPAVVATSHSVTEVGAAKYTELQELFDGLNRHGMGGDSLFGDLARKAGLVEFAMTAIPTIGRKVVGTAFHALADYNGYEPKRPQAQNRRRRKQLRSPRGPFMQNFASQRTRRANNPRTRSNNASRSSRRFRGNTRRFQANPGRGMRSRRILDNLGRVVETLV